MLRATSRRVFLTLALATGACSEAEGDPVVGRIAAVTSVSLGPAGAPRAPRDGFELIKAGLAVPDDWNVRGRITEADSRRLRFVDGAGSEYTLLYDHPFDGRTIPIGTRVHLRRRVGVNRGAVNDSVVLSRDDLLVLGHHRWSSARPIDVQDFGGIRLIQEGATGTSTASQTPGFVGVPVTLASNGGRATIGKEPVSVVRLGPLSYRARLGGSHFAVRTPEQEAAAEAPPYFLDLWLARR